MSEESVLSTTTPVAIAPVEEKVIKTFKENFSFNVIKSFFVFLISRFSLLCFGIFIGMGIVIKFSPEIKKLKEQVEVLKKENIILKTTPKDNNYNWSQIKDSIILKK
jgi:cell division protein FtsB